MADFPYVQAFHTFGTRRGPALAFTIHMAEGGGTVGYLSRQNPNGVSVHFVIEYSGRIVQMLALTAVSGSVNPGKLRTTNDPDGFFGVTAAKAVMGTWWSNPNHAMITAEIEGFAAKGPNTAQKAALVKLRSYLVGKYPGIRNLGHRDWQDYKACPGKLIPWNLIGGHGATSTAPEPVPSEEVVIAFTVPEKPTLAYLKPDPADATKSVWLYFYSDFRVDPTRNKQLGLTLNPATGKQWLRPLGYVGGWGDVKIVAYEPSAEDTNASSTAMFVKAAEVAKYELVPSPTAPADDSPFTQAQVDVLTKQSAKAAAADVAQNVIGAATAAAGKYP